MYIHHHYQTTVFNCTHTHTHTHKLRFTPIYKTIIITTGRLLTILVVFIFTTYYDMRVTLTALNFAIPI
jgi:hypothetical protein